MANLSVLERLELLMSDDEPVNSASSQADQLPKSEASSESPLSHVRDSSRTSKPHHPKVPVPGLAVHDSSSKPRPKAPTTFDSASTGTMAASSPPDGTPISSHDVNGTFFSRPRGTLVPRGETFTPILALSKLPKLISDKQLSKLISERHFEDGTFWSFRWDLYYVWPKFTTSKKPLLLTPVHRAQQFLDRISAGTEGTILTIGKLGEGGLQLTFDSEHPNLRPRFLGLSFSSQQFNNLEKHVPDHSFRPRNEPAVSGEPAHVEIIAFKSNIESVMDLSRTKPTSKATRKANRVAQQHDWKDQLKQAERFFGVRPPAPGSTPEMRDSVEDDWATFQSKERLRSKCRNPGPIDLSYKSPWPFADSVIFVAVDVESYERDTRLITEIGISTLNSLELANIAPGANAENWTSKIRSRHLRVREYAHLYNSEFVKGDPAGFSFGKSEFVRLGDAPKVIADCFRHPVSSGLVSAGDTVGTKNQPIVIVGHDVGNDIRYLERLGYCVTNLNILHADTPILDTQSLFKAFVHDTDAKSLVHILREFGIPAVGLHNAGNDAAYTMQALIRIALTSAKERGTEEAKARIETARQAKVEQAIEMAMQKASEDAEGWESEDGAKRQQTSRP